MVLNLENQIDFDIDTARKRQCKISKMCQTFDYPVYYRVIEVIRIGFLNLIRYEMRPMNFPRLLTMRPNRKFTRSAVFW